MASNFARNSAFNVVAGLSTTISGFVSTILVARLLGVEGTGIVAYATWIVTMVLVVTDLGLTGALARYLPELRGAGEHNAAAGLTRYLFRRFLLGLGVVSACFAAYAVIATWRGSSIQDGDGDSFLDTPAFWAIVGSACLVQGLAAFNIGYLKGTEAFRRLALVAAVSGVMQIATTLLGGWLFGVVGAMTAAIFGHIVPACLVVASVARKGSVSPALKRRVNRFTWESWAGYMVMAFAWSRMEIFFLERSWGSDAAGLFAVSLTLANLATQAPMLLTGALLPYLSQHASGDTAHKARDAYTVGMRLMAFVVFPACFGVAAIAPRLLPTLFGPDFTQAIPAAMILVSAAAFSASASVALTYLFAMERTRVVFTAGALGAILSILVGLLLVPLYGTNAAAAGRGVIQIMVVAVAIGYIDRKLECRTPYGALARLLAAALICAGVAFLVLMAVPGLVGLAAAVLAGAGAYVLSVRLLAALPQQDIERLIGAATTILPRPLHGFATATLRLMGSST